MNEPRCAHLGIVSQGFQPELRTPLLTIVLSCGQKEKHWQLSFWLDSMAWNLLCLLWVYIIYGETNLKFRGEVKPSSERLYIFFYAVLFFLLTVSLPNSAFCQKKDNRKDIQEDVTVTLKLIQVYVTDKKGNLLGFPMGTLQPGKYVLDFLAEERTTGARSTTRAVFSVK
jgi:hypothetical protein